MVHVQYNMPTFLKGSKRIQTQDALDTFMFQHVSNHLTPAMNALDTFMFQHVSNHLTPAMNALDTFMFQHVSNHLTPAMNALDTFMFQHVSNPTRVQGTTNTNLLDLILSNEEDKMGEIEYLSPLGQNDHCVITFNI